MIDAGTISEKIFRRWCEKLHKEKTIPKKLVDTIQELHKQRKLYDPKALIHLLEQMGGAEYDKN